MRHQLNPATATQWSRQVARPWRAVFLLYVLVLTVGSNWPGMHFRIGEQVSPDKLVHAIAFGGLATLLWRTRWLRARWQVGLIVLVWAAAAELVQVLPIFRRTLSIEDMVAGQIGVLLVVVWWWAIAPIGGTASQLRHARRAFIVGGMFLRPRYWIASAGAAGIGAVVMGGGHVDGPAPDRLAAVRRDRAHHGGLRRRRSRSACHRVGIESPPATDVERRPAVLRVRRLVPRFLPRRLRAGLLPHVHRAESSRPVGSASGDASGHRAARAGMRGGRRCVIVSRGRVSLRDRARALAVGRCRRKRAAVVGNAVAAHAVPDRACGCYPRAYGCLARLSGPAGVR